ncbi:MAG TPA: hypothetical protein VLI04_00595 [Nocardioidaceae bacterium]|nr:hypothetical protein [Nocardioidaceae bacterium]
MTIQETRPAERSLVNVAADYTMLRVSLWAVVIYCLFGLAGFAVFAGFWPPPAEHLDAAGIADYFRSNDTGIRVGMVLMAFGAPFYFVWSVVLSKIISRIEGPMGPLSMVELLGGLLTALVTLVPPTIWITASFRLESRSDETISMLYDFGWFFFDLTFICSVLQNVALAIAIIRDRRAKPLFPQWVAAVAVLTAITYFPLTLLPFMRSGPFAWHGLLNFWAVFVMFFVLIAVVTPYAFKALRRLEEEERG